MTYPDLIAKFILTGSGALIFLSVVVLVLTLIISIVTKWLIIPKIKKFLGLMDSLLTRMEHNEKELTNVKHDVEITKQDFANTRHLVENIAEISSEHIGEMRLMVNEIQDAVKQISKELTTLNTEHKLYHYDKETSNDTCIHKPERNRPKSNRV